jgi:hypothetical protein
MKVTSVPLKMVGPNPVERINRFSSIETILFEARIHPMLFQHINGNSLDLMLVGT